jgi:hypothetical protein
MSTAGSEALQQSYDTELQSLRVKQPSFSYLTPMLASVSSITYDAVSGDLSGEETDVYVLVSGGLEGDVQGTFTITYTDAKKVDVFTIVRT